MNDPLDAAPSHAIPVRAHAFATPDVALVVASFLAIGLAIMAAAWPAIDVRNVEIGDFAANSLLIQDAKHLRLLTGNYSRIGVHHPGPAILYVLAFGEWLLSDLLHLTRSPFSGQLVAGCFYTAAWVVVVWRELRKLCGSRTDAALATSVFVLTLACWNTNFFADIWFPNLYVFPYAAMSLSMARLVSGRTDSLVALAVSAGFLINGHVSFVSTTGVILLIAVAVNLVWFRSVPERRIVGATFLRTHSRAILVAIGIFALFLVPLAIETIVAWPGPVPGYRDFGADRIVHPARDSALFVADFWGGVAPVLGFAAAAALVVAAGRRLPALRSGLAALVVVFVASTIALFVYARYGIDYLDLKYTGYYYYTTPALLFAVVALVGFKLACEPRGGAPIAIALACVGAVVTYRLIDRPAQDVDQYNQPGVVALYEAVRNAATDGRIVLNLDDRVEWGLMWTNLVGAELLARRQGQNLFCVNRNYHILFSDHARCTAAELDTRPQYIVRVEHAPRHTVPTFEAMGIGFIRYRIPDVTDAGPLRVDKDSDRFADYFLTSGWTAPGGEYVWSSGREAHLTLRVRPGFAGALELDCGAFLAPGHERVTGRLWINDVPSGSFEFTTADARHVVKLPIPPGDGHLDVKVVVDDPISPRDVGQGDDPRLLGISLFGFEATAS